MPWSRIPILTPFPAVENVGSPQSWWATAPASGGEASPTTTSVEAVDAAAGAGAKSEQTSRKSRPRLREPMLRAATMPRRADVAELVDAHGSGPCGGDPVEVQVLSSA